MSGPALQVGGTLRPRRHIYIERSTDDELFKLLLDAEPVHVLASCQMGKSSLVARTTPRLQERGRRCATVDVAGSLGSEEDPDRWYMGLLEEIRRGLDLRENVEGFWRSASGTRNQTFLAFFREVVTPRASPAVIFLDAIDATLRLPYTDDLFVVLRALDDERHDPDGVTFCLLGAAAPNELVKDRRTAAYNIGSTLELRDFDPAVDDLSPLYPLLHQDVEAARRRLEEILDWTGGHPYLTLRFCAGLKERQTPPVGAYAEEAFPDLESLAGDVHFQQIHDFLEHRVADPVATLQLYERVLQGREERERSTLPNLQLRLAGLVRRRRDGSLEVRNRLYRRLFNEDWIRHVQPKRTLGPYEIESQVAQTQRGALYRADHPALGRQVALKHIRHDVEDASVVEQLWRGARVVASLNHPAIVRIYDLVETREGLWIVMEWVEGQTLRSVLQDGPPPLGEALSMALEIAEGLAEAHENGIVHRDLRTENVMVTAPGRVKILDFGLAKQIIESRDVLLTQAGLLSGVRALAPEQAQDLSADHRSDLFALGSLLYEVLTGRHPFAGSSFLETMANLCNRTQEPAKVVQPSVPAKLSILIDRLLAKSPEDRPQSAGEVVAILEAVLGRRSSPGRTDGGVFRRGEARIPAVPAPAGVAETGALSIIGRHVDAYRIEERIGAGGLGDVYRAWDEHLERRVALKRIRRGGGASPGDFWREARAVSGIHHAAVVQVYDIVETEDNDWLVMELLDGVTLHQLMESTPLDLEVAIDLARQIADGLAEIHAHGIVHRDLKAGNVMVAMDGQVPRQAKILDFGLAERLTRRRDAKGTGSSSGSGPMHSASTAATIRAMSPEQATGRPVDERSDLFSFGILLYEMITRQHPFAGRGFFQPLVDVQRKQQVPAWEVNCEVPEELSILVDQLLAKNPAHRPPSARAVRRALDKIRRRLLSLEADTVVGARLPRGLTRMRPKGRPRGPGPWRRWTGVALTVGFLALASAGLLLGPGRIFGPRPSRLTVTAVEAIPGHSREAGSLALRDALPPVIEVGPGGAVDGFEVTLTPAARHPWPRPGASMAGRYRVLCRAADGRRRILTLRLSAVGGDRFRVTVEAVDEGES